MCQRTLHRPTFLERKGRQKNFPQIHHFILAKLLKFQETFPEKFLVSEFEAEASTDNAHKKARHCRAFLICQYMLELPFQTLLQGAFFKKPLENPQKLPSNLKCLLKKSVCACTARRRKTGINIKNKLYPKASRKFPFSAHSHALVVPQAGHVIWNNL